MVLQMAGVERQVLYLVKQHKLKYLGHILRGECYGMNRLVIQGRIDGKISPGRKQLS